MSIQSCFIKSIQKVLFFGFFIAGIFVTNGLNGQQNIGPYNIMLKDGWKHNGTKSDASDHYLFEKDGMSVAIPKSPQDASGGVNKFIMDYANKLKGSDEFIEQQKQSVPVSLYGKSQSARLTIKSKSTGARRFVYLTMVDNKVYETLIEGNAINMDPAPEAIQFLSKVSVDQNAGNKTYANDTQYRTADVISPTQFPPKPADALPEGSLSLPLPGNEMEDTYVQNQKNKEVARIQKEIKVAINHEITEYINRYQNTCFGKKFNLGDPAKFSEAIDKQINFIYVGEAGTKKIKETGPDAKARHLGWKDPIVGNIADLMFPFDPRNIPSGDKGNENRKTLMHEMTHHIEFLKGLKESSTTYIYWDNPNSERNTHYQEGVFTQMFELSLIEGRLAKSESNIADELFKFREVEMKLHDLEKGSGASGNPPDKNLDMMTGFTARFDLIENHYLSGECDPKLRKLVLLYRLLPRIDPKLHTDDVTINLGEEVVAKALLQYKINEENFAELNIPTELKPIYSWNLPDKRMVTGNPLRYKPETEGKVDIPVELSVTFEKEKLVIATGNVVVTVNPNEKGTNVTSIKIPDKVLATELVDVEVTVPNDVKSKNVEYEWSPCASGSDKNTAKTKIQFSNPGDKPLSSNVSVYGKDASGNSITTVEKKVTVIPVIFPAPNLIPEGQESSSGPWGAHVNGLFKEQKREGHVPAKVYVALEVSWCNSDCSKKYEDWEKEMQKNPNLKRKMIALDDFQGFIYQSDFKRDCRGSGYVDLGYLDCNISGKGFVVKGCLGIYFEYNVYGTGVIEGEGSGFCKFENLGHDDSEFLKATVLESQQKVMSYLESIKLVPKP